jgi:hypothetical protein
LRHFFKIYNNFQVSKLTASVESLTGTTGVTSTTSDLNASQFGDVVAVAAEGETNMAATGDGDDGDGADGMLDYRLRY